MKWIPQQFLLPLLISFSLTGVSLAVIYLLNKKQEEDDRKKQAEADQHKETRMDVPRQFLPAIIGRGGSKVKEIENITNTRIEFEEDNIECPNRTCIVKGPKKGVYIVLEMITQIILNKPLIGTYEIYVPQKVWSRISARCGYNFHGFHSTSSAKIIVDNNYLTHDPNAERRLILKGTSEQIATTVNQIEDKVRKEKEILSKLEVSSASRSPRGKLSPRNNGIYTVDNVECTESVPLQIADGLIEVYVSVCNSPSQFWIQLVGPGTIALDELINEMNLYYNKEDNREAHILRNVTLDRLVAARFSVDNQWYRAKVISTPKDGVCDVFFLDFGDVETADVSQIFELRTDLLSLRLQAIECSLANVKPR